MQKILLLLLATSLITSSCSFVAGKKIKGNGNLSSEQRSPGDFDGINSAGSFDVVVSIGAAQTVKIEAEENLLPYIETNVSESTLNIRTKEGYRLNPKRDIKIHVTSPSFSKIKLSGSGNITTDQKIANPTKIELALSGSGDIKVDVDAPDVIAELAGSGNIRLSGETRTFRGEVRGSGDIRAMDLKTEETNIDIMGSGNADVFASVKLHVDVKGSGDVKYKGGANSVTSDIKGSGSVRKVD